MSILDDSLAQPARQADRTKGCGPYPNQASSLYILPWEVDASFVVESENCRPGSPTHSGNPKHAYDFTMPIGTPIHAARSGVVLDVEDLFRDGNRVPGSENQIFVRHEDGTVARYYHLTYQGVFVTPGDSVTQGQRIGLSGNTGNSANPHLHFDVTEVDCGEPFFGPLCVTVPITFRNTRQHPSGLQLNEAYTAGSL